jgi:hypothetical protein
MAYIHNLCYSLNVVREQISCINTCKSWIMLVDFIVVVLEEKVNCVVHLFVLNFCSSSCVHCVLSWLKMLVDMWKKAKALMKNCHCRMNTNCMLSVEHIELISS